MADLARRSLIAALAAGLVLGGAPALAKPPAQPKPQHLKLETLDIVTSRGPVRFKVQVADTPATRDKGFMFRMSLPPDEGMLFDFKRPQRVAFWMKNTFIPLDLIFIGADGRVVSIARNAQPHDETPIPGNGMILGVLEIPGGRAAQIGVLPGDRVLHRIFPRG